MRIIRFQNCIVRADEARGYTETVFPDGCKVPAYPVGGPGQRGTAAALGYGGDLAAMCREHEILHTWLCEQFGLPHSPTLWAVAHGHGPGCAPVWAQHGEEELVLGFQAFLNEAEPAGALESLRGRGLCLGRLREDAKRLLRAA